MTVEEPAIKAGSDAGCHHFSAGESPPLGETNFNLRGAEVALRPSMTFRSPLVAVLLWAMATGAALGDPVTFKEVSLLVRMQESPAEIGNQIARRKLFAPLTAQEIDLLRAQGASEQVIQFAQDPRNHLSAQAAAQFLRTKAAALAAAQQNEAMLAQQQAARASTPPAPIPDDRNTELKYAKEAIQWGKPLNLAKYGGSDTDIFVKTRSGKFYTVDIGSNDRRIPAALPSVPAASPDGSSFPPEMFSHLGARSRKKVEKRDPVKISTERGDLYLAFVDKPSGIHVYLLDDNVSAPVNTDLLIVSPKKF